MTILKFFKMRRNILTQIFFCLTFSILFMSCQEKKNALQTSTDAAVASNSDMIDFPGKIPADVYLHELSQDGPISWTEYDKYYRMEVLQEKGKHYYDNLRWATFGVLFVNSDFLEASSLNDKEYYLEQMFSTKLVNNPRLVHTLLTHLAAQGSTLDIPAYARRIVEINKTNYSEEAYEYHLAKHKNTYNQIYALGWNRWGEEL